MVPVRLDIAILQTASAMTERPDVARVNFWIPETLIPDRTGAHFPEFPHVSAA
jgi:hypothetical protein